METAVCVDGVTYRRCWGVAGSARHGLAVRLLITERDMRQINASATAASSACRTLCRRYAVEA